MPFKEHPEFLLPDSPDSKIWRYMDLTKFLSLLEKSCLYFCRFDQLSKFDPFEGYYTNLNLEIDKVKFEDTPLDWRELTGIKDKKIFEMVIGSNKHMRDSVKYHRSVTFVNSWHIKEHESAAMWKIYLSNNEGIAIQSTYQKLIDSIAAYKDFEVYVGRIKYIDYEKEIIPVNNLLSPFLYKRKSFEYEDELRALIWTPQHGKNDIQNPQNNKFKDVFGIYVPVNLEKLVEHVYVAPNAPTWILKLIKSVTEKFQLNKEVIQSNLASTPVY